MCINKRTCIDTIFHIHVLVVMLLGIRNKPRHSSFDFWQVLKFNPKITRDIAESNFFLIVAF